MTTSIQRVRSIGQSLWLDNISRALLDEGTLQRYIDEWSVSGVTSNPTIFDQAIGGGTVYDGAIRDHARSTGSDEELFMTLALEDLRRAADMLRPVFDATGGVDGWVSMEVSPLLVDDTAGSITSAARILAQADRPNLFVKIPGTPAGVAAIEESIFRGVPVNVTLLFSREQYLAAAEAYLRGIERRLDAGRDPRVASVASLFVSRWDAALHDRVPPDMRNTLGIAVAVDVYQAYRELLASARWQALAKRGAQPQRLLWASTGTKDPDAPDCLYVDALAAPDTINTLPEKTLHAFADHGQPRDDLASAGAAAAATRARFTAAGVDLDALASTLQLQGAQSFSKSWNRLMEGIARRRAQLSAA